MIKKVKRTIVIAVNDKGDFTVDAIRRSTLDVYADEVSPRKVIVLGDIEIFITEKEFAEMLKSKLIEFGVKFD